MAVCIATVATLLAMLWNFLVDYETHTPQNALNQYFRQLSAGEYDDLKQGAAFTPDEYNGWEEYFAVLRERFPGDAAGYEYRQTSSREVELGQNDKLYAVYSGETKLGEVKLTEDRNAPTGWVASSAVEYQPGYTITAPQHAVVSVNGVQLSADGAEKTPLKVFSGSLNDESLAPAQYTYQTPQTLRVPVFTAQGPGGGPCTVTVDEASRTVTVTVDLTEEQLAEYTSRVEQTALAWSGFTTEDVTRTELKPYLYEDTRFYKEMLEYQLGWYLNHDPPQYLDMNIHDIVSTSETTFTGRIDFTVHVVRQGQLHEFKPSYYMGFLLVDGQWLLVDL